MTPTQIIEADAGAIYIGNIYTIEADLILPIGGQNGADISWASDKPHLISPEGKVTRPREGAGDREVILTATISHGGESVTREFTATVLALKSNVKILEAIDIAENIPQGEDFELPGVVIVKKDDGTFGTAVVTWQTTDFAALDEGTYEISGELSDTDVAARAVITVKAGYARPAKLAPVLVAAKCDMGDVQIIGGFFNDNRMRAEEFLLSCDLDALLYNFREAAGLDTKEAAPMSGWDAPECLLKGHTTGHYLSAIALAYAGKTANQARFGEIMAYMVDGLAECQEAMENSGNFAVGFLSGYSEEQFDKLEEYVVYPKIWAPYYTLHKILAGLVDCYERGGYDKALDVAAKLGIWVYNRLSKLPKEQLQKMWAMYIAGEFGGINESLARIGKHVEWPEFVAAAKLFDNERLFYPMERNVDSLGGIHGNQHVPQVIGALEICARGGGAEYYHIARNFWHMVTSAHIYNIGGAGEGEMFQDAHKIGTALSEKTAESCVSYNMLKLTAMLFEYEPVSEYMDYYERALYNHIAASQDQSGPVGGSTYFMPLLPGGQKRYDTSANTCCRGTGLENHVKYQEAIYYLRGASVYVNLYIPSMLAVPGGGSLALISDFLSHAEGHRAVIKIGRDGFSELRLRIPGWNKGRFSVTLNGEPLACVVDDGYAVVTGFNEGDEVVAEFSFALRIEPTADAPDIVALYYGPLAMVLLNDSDNFVEFNQNFWQNLTQTADFEFTLNNHKFVPNYYADKEKYHAYVKIV